MGEAIVRGIIENNLASPGQITISDVAEPRLEYLKNKYAVSVTNENSTAVKNCDLLFIAVKPQVIDTVLGSIASLITRNTLVVSIAAGISIETIQNYLPEIPLVRVMPNTPVAVGAGMAAFALGAYATQEDGELVASIFSACGRAVLVAEKDMDAVTGLSGSGPGYGFVIIDALADAGVRVGLPRQTAITLAAQTLLGAAKLVLETQEHPAKLRDMVTSPGGTTIAGIHALEEKGVRAALIDAVIAATTRSSELGKK